MKTSITASEALSVPQHPKGYFELKEAYVKLYESICANYGTDGLCRFFAMEGSCYNKEIKVSDGSVPTDSPFPTNEDAAEKVSVPAVRLMVVGRCVNGWDALTEKSADEFAENGTQALLHSGFSWLNDNGIGITPYTRPSDGKECRYNINRSAFFRCIRKVVNELKPITTMHPRWFEHIVWSNLYTVAPINGGNATGKLQKVQLEISKEILLSQIELYHPTHLLFITDWDWWFDRFTDIFPDVAKVGSSATDNVVGKGNYNGIKIAVTVRPDRTRPSKPNEEQFAKDVIKAYT